MPENKLKPSKYVNVGSVLLFTCLVSAGIYFSSRKRVEVRDDQSGNPAIARNRKVDVGGVRRPESDLVLYKQKEKPRAEGAPSPQLGYGRAPHVDPDENASVKLTYSALVDAERKHPERTNPMIMPAAFDKAVYLADRTAYLALSEPGRVWQAAQPGPEVPVLRRLGDLKQTLRQKESVRLETQAAPDAPVTFTSFDSGVFSNQLPSITVAADSKGLANAVFTATSGTISRINIMAASPMTSGRVEFHINVLPAIAEASTSR